MDHDSDASPEAMAALFDARAIGYDDHMRETLAERETQ